MFISELICYWTAVTFYVLATVFFTWAVFFEAKAKLTWGLWGTVFGLVAHSAATVVRWYMTGHGPYLNKFEGISSTVWIVMATFLVVSYWRPKLRFAGMVVLPMGFLLIGMGIFSTPQIQNLPGTFQTFWLIVHILFAKLTLGTILISLACAVFFILKQRTPEKPIYTRLPELAGLDMFSYRFCGMGFVFWTISIIAGSIWAYKSWGRYWAWDPIETWSLITWLLFGLYLHMRRFMALKERKAAYCMIICFIFVVATLFIIPFITKTIHTEYLL